MSPIEIDPKTGAPVILPKNDFVAPTGISSPGTIVDKKVEAPQLSMPATNVTLDQRVQAAQEFNKTLPQVNPQRTSLAPPVKVRTQADVHREITDVLRTSGLDTQQQQKVFIAIQEILAKE